jgi:hypothetical protein
MHLPHSYIAAATYRLQTRVLRCRSFIWGRFLKLWGKLAGNGVNTGESTMKYFNLLIVFMAVIASGCASIVGGGSSETLTFNSEPDGATVTISGRTVGKTPVSVEVKRDKNKTVTFEKDGYKTQTAQLSTTLNGWFWGNILIGGFLGSTTDSVSGAMYEFQPDQYFVTLAPVAATRIQPQSSQKAQIKELVVGFGEEIRLELAAGGGEYTSALIALLGNESGNQDAAIRILKKLADENQNDLNLSNAIIDFYNIP